MIGSLTTTTNPNPTVECPHLHFHAMVDTERDTLKVYVQVTCKQCGKPIIFPGQGERAILQGTFL